MTPGPQILRFCVKEGPPVFILLHHSEVNPAPGGAHSKGSVPISRVDVFRQRLSVVALLAKSLPVALVPEQLLVTTVRYNVIHHCSLGVPSQFHALHAQRMALKVGFACLLPSAAVSAFGCGACHLRVERQVLCAVQLAGFHQLRATGLTARHFRSVRHSQHLLQLCLDDIPAQFCV